MAVKEQYINLKGWQAYHALFNCDILALNTTKQHNISANKNIKQPFTFY